MTVKHPPKGVAIEDSFEKAVSKLRLEKCTALRDRSKWLSLERIRKHFLTIKASLTYSIS